MSAIINDANLIEAPEFDIVIKDYKDILHDIEFENKNDVILTETIVLSLEKSIKSAIDRGEVASIPSLGCLRKDLLKIYIKDYYNEFRHMRKLMSLREYKLYVIGVVQKIRKRIAEDDYAKANLIRIKALNKKKYEKLYLILGRAYANLYIKAISYLTYIPYDQDVEDAFNNIKD